MTAILAARNFSIQREEIPLSYVFISPWQTVEELEITSSNNQQPIDFGATGAAEIDQNIRMILSTPEFSCPMERDFAWNPAIDVPTAVAKEKTTARIAAAIRKYEPRAQLVSVTYQENAENGILKPIVRVNIPEEVTS